MNKFLKLGILGTVASLFMKLMGPGFLLNLMGPGLLLSPVGQGFLTLLFPISVILLVIGVITSFVNRAGFGKGFGYAQSARNSGIAVNPERRQIKLKEGSRIKEYDFSDVRGWRSNLQVGGTTAFGGMTGSVHNIGVLAQNRKVSGLFVSVRDVDNPEWHIKLYDRKSQARWMEILDQTINESSP